MLDTPELARKRILLIDPNHQKSNDRTWCFWTDQPLPFDPIIYRRWQKLRILSPTLDLSRQLDRLSYQMIRGEDFYAFVYERIAACPNVELRQTSVSQLSSDDKCAHITCQDGEQYTADWAFDSRFSYDDLGKSLTLRQHFKGWVIETESPVFDPEEVTLFDMRTPQPDGLYFFYILPFTKNRALVEYTVFSSELLTHPSNYEIPLRTYINTQLHITDFTILEEEFGVIPMTNHRFDRRPSPRVMTLGVAGGRAKASTGYAFLRAQRDAESIVRALRTQKNPFYKPTFDRHFWFYDTLLLDIMYREGGLTRELFEQLFQNNPIERLLLFLDERSNFYQDLRVMASVNPQPFILSIYRLLTHQIGTKRP